MEGINVGVKVGRDGKYVGTTDGLDVVGIIEGIALGFTEGSSDG